MNNPTLVKTEETSTTLDIEQLFFEVQNPMDKYSLLKKLFFHYQPASTLIFCNTKEKTKELFTALCRDGFSTTTLHGDLEQNVRDQAMIQFEPTVFF